MAEADSRNDDLYAILEVRKTASVEQIKRSYQRLVKQVQYKRSKTENKKIGCATAQLGSSLDLSFLVPS